LFLQCTPINDSQNLDRRRANYECHCLAEYYSPNLTSSSSSSSSFSSSSSPSSGPSSAHFISGFDAQANYIVSQLLNSTDAQQRDGRLQRPEEFFQCRQCAAGCPNCSDNSSCIVVFDSFMRGIPMGIESLCITLFIALTLAIVHLRKTKVICA